MSDVEEHGRGPGGQGDDFGPLLLGLAIGIVAVVLVWVFVAVMRSSPSDGDSTAPAHLGGPAGALSAAEPRPFVPTRLDRCTTAAASLAPPLHAAKAALDQWAVHVGAMNQLVVGAISLPQATAFWTQTRVGAQRHIGAFAAAERSSVRRGVDCPAPALVGTSASFQLRACSRHVAAMESELQAARTAIQTWHRHVLAMEQLRLGKLSGATAGQMWLAMWQRGTHELDAYRIAARTTQVTHGCHGAPPPSSRRAHPRTDPSSSPSPTTSMQPMH